MKKFKSKLIVPIALTLTFQGCMPDSLTKFNKDEAKKAPAAVVSTSPTAPPDLTSLKTFQLKNITGNSTSYHLHKYGAGNSTAACEIPIANITDGETALTDQTNDILCWLEADEIQLFFNGANFQFNVPAQQCEYIQVKPYYFWNIQPATTTKVVKSVTCAEANSGCAAVGGVTEADITCEGDYTKAGGPNCDEGYVVVHNYAVAADTPAVVGPPAVPAKLGLTTKTTTVIGCGGRRTACLAGPGVDFLVDKGGFPIPIDYLAYNGESINYSVTAPGPLGKGFGSNHYISNYTKTYADPTPGSNLYDYSAIATATGLEKYSNTSAVTTYTYNDLGSTSFDDNTGKAGTDIAVIDYGLDPLKRADGSIKRTGATSWAAVSTKHSVQPFYEFSCLNYAHEVKARIRLQVREWNQIFQTPVANFTEVSEAAPTRLLKHSANATDYETSGVGYWNDVASWDIITGYGSNAAYTPPYPTTVNDFGFLFPRLGF